MNYYAILASLLVGIFLFYIKLGGIGLIFILVGIVIAFSDNLRQGARNTWNEVDKAEGSYPEGKMKEYLSETAKVTAKIATVKNEEGLNTPEYFNKTHNVSKGFFSQLKDLFK